MDNHNPRTPKPGTVEAPIFPGSPRESASSTVVPSASTIPPVLPISGLHPEVKGLARVREVIRQEGIRYPVPPTPVDLGLTGPSQD